MQDVMLKITHLNENTEMLFTWKYNPWLYRNSTFTKQIKIFITKKQAVYH